MLASVAVDTCWAVCCTFVSSACLIKQLPEFRCQILLCSGAIYIEAYQMQLHLLVNAAFGPCMSGDLILLSIVQKVHV